MIVRLVDIDSKIPNLALMKLATLHRVKGDTVEMSGHGGADAIYASCIFAWNRRKAEALKDNYPDAIIGGSGWSLYSQLPVEIEQMRPDYSLYGIGYGLGYTSRGCIRHCQFCVVPAKEGHIRSVSTVAEIVNPLSSFVVLLDNNFLAQDDWEARLDEIERLKLTVNFSQGLDIRLVDRYVAERLARIDFANLKRTKKQMHFAFDHLGLEGTLRWGLTWLFAAGIKPYQLAFYLLTGFNSTFDEDMQRFEILRGLGVDPFVMVYNKKHDRQLNAFSRWVNRRLYKSCKWDEYKGWNRAKAQAEFVGMGAS